MTNRKMAEPPAQRKRIVHQVKWWQSLALWPLACLHSLWMMTLRFPGARSAGRELAGQEGLVFALWHNRSFCVVALHQRYRRPRRELWGMVSASRDGALMSAYFERVGIRSVRGSTTHRGMQAARELLDKLRHGADVGLTVDGPRGPKYQVQEGAALLAVKSGAKVVLISPEYSRYWEFKSWDNYRLPKPFCRVDVRYTIIEPGEDRGVLRSRMEEGLRALTGDYQPPA